MNHQPKATAKTTVNRIVTPIDLNSSVTSSFNSDIAELLGFTKEYINANAGVQLPDNIIGLATEIALTSSKLNLLCQKFDKLLSAAKILEVQRKQIEWAEMVSTKRAERAAKERVKIVKSLRGFDKRMYNKTGELPHEYEERIRAKFNEFMEMMKKTEVL